MKYEFSGKVRYSEIDEKGELSLNSLVNYFQDVSTFQSEELGVGIEYLRERHAAWILSSWQIVIDHRPGLCQKVTAQTWPYDFNRLYGMRNFALLDEQGKMAAWANSVWVLLDTETGRPLRVFPEVLEKYELEAPLEMDYAPRKVVLPEGGQEQEAFAIGRHHLDTNHHVNNGQYIAMAAEYLPEGFEIHQMRAEYKLQARLHDEVVPVIYRKDGRTTVALNNPQGKPYAVVEFLDSRTM